MKPEPSSRDEEPLTGDRVADLRRGLEAGEIVPYYQPQVDVFTGAVVGAEALARWQHPERGLLGPAEFVGVAERHGLIDALTVVMLEQAVRDCLAGDERGWRWGVSVNVASSSLVERDLVAEVVGVLDRHGLPPSRLTLEITESMMMEHPEQTRGVLAALRSAGMRISIDDFGMGYSSLGRLHQLPIDELKVDRSFLADLRKGRDPVVLRTIVGLGRRLGYRVVAEGIEDERDMAVLASLGCQVAQGFWLARPLPPAAFAGWLDDRSKRRRATIAQGPLATGASPQAPVSDPDSASLPSRLHRALSETLTSALSVEETCQRALERLGVETAARAAVWWRVDHQAQTLEHQSAWLASDTELPNWSRVTQAMSIAPGVGVAGQVLETGRPAWASEPHDREPFVRTEAASLDGLSGPLLAFPVTCEEQKLGVIELWDAPLAELVSASTETLLDVGHRLGQFVQRLTAEQNAQSYALALRVLHGSLRHLTRPQDPAALRSALCSAAREIASADVALLWEPTPDETELTVTGCAGWRGARFRTRLSDEASGAAVAFKSRQPYFVSNLQEDAVILQRLATRLGAKSALYHPIPSHRRTIAVLVLAWREPLQRLPPAVAPAIEILSDHAVPALLAR